MGNKQFDIKKMALALVVLVILLIFLMAYFPLMEPMPRAVEFGMPGI